MRIEDRGVVYATTNGPADERIACFASLLVSRKGTLFTAFQLGEIKNSPRSTLRLCRSDDGGTTWKVIHSRFPTTFADIAGSLSNGELFELDDGRLLLISTWIDRREPSRPFFDPVSEGIIHTRILKAFSEDDGTSWSEWEEIPLATPGWSYHTSGPIVRGADGVIVFVAESHKAFDAIGQAATAEASWFMISTDQGKSFQGPHCVARHPEHWLFYWDARLAPGPSADSWLALYWTHDQPNERDLPVHLQQGRVGETGVDPGPVRNTGIPGQISAPLCLDDRHWLGVVVSRDRPGTITVWQTHDAGENWTAALTVYSHDDGQTSGDRTETAVAEIWENIGKWGFGHPAIRRLDSKRLLVTWYAGSPEGMHIHWARIALGESAR